MNAEGWMQLVRDAVYRHDAGDVELLSLLAALLAEQDNAKEQLRRLGFGCTGRPWLGVVEDVRTYLDEAKR